MNILVTGTPGSGKTTLSNYAKSVNDQRFFDADEVDELCEWRRFDTGEVIGSVKDEMGNLVESGEDDWYKVYGWYWREPVIQELLEKNDDVILCGSSENIVDFYSLFDNIILLKVDEATLLKHLSHPARNNPFGQTAEQRKNFMGWQDYLLNEARKYQPVIIELRKVDDIYTKVLGEIGKRPSR
jgi:broad-specificity NMP kinase